ncbi:type-2 ice-structuring protein-like [Oreochromis niloticus]|uniref:type-2 ice-structuring protein-like n=1 Tax=Oreochromis niloticus TaxID=8128 RepID=UPI0009056CF1|nr:type-2 ice-structuring protein-like [Oreochromis niloticus]CAI5661135.1 unnamed protein product [Mustela putorius furo]
MMKALTVPLLVCTMMALAQVSSVPATVPDYSSIPLTDPSPVPEDPFGGWVPSCPDGWSMHSQQCLLFVPTYMTWAEAQRNCQSRGGQLASVYSANQAEEIQKEVQRAGHGYGQFWVGGHNTAANPSWSWSDYMGVSAFADFCRGQEAKHKHHCLQITFGEGKAGCLDDMKCETKLPSICGSLIM